MNRQQTLPTPDAIPGWGRIILYALAMVLPFSGQILGHITQAEALATTITLLGVIGPMVAIVYTKKTGETEQAQFNQGYATAVDDHVVNHEGES